MTRIAVPAQRTPGATEALAESEALAVPGTARTRPPRDIAVVDLRSDTVTRPDAEMRAAMASAEVGDDILDGDPTMRALEDRAAELLGVEAALWLPSGSMANHVALTIQLRPGDRFLAPRLAHVLEYELGAAAWLAGGMPAALPWSAGPGRITATSLRRTPSPGPMAYDALRDRLLCLENTHNAAGGTVTPPGEHRAVVAAAKAAGLSVHLDGARIWNAAVAARTSPAELTRGVDSVQACLSKGLGAPMGSVLGGSAGFVREARRVRKMLGGAVRQGGVVAAAGLIALNRVQDLEADHVKARLLARGLRDQGWNVNVPETNVVLAEVADADRTVAELRGAGVLAAALAGCVRMVTHRDVTEKDVRGVVARAGRLAAAGWDTRTGEWRSEGTAAETGALRVGWRTRRVPRPAGSPADASEPPLRRAR
ncbi:GntG family PLP-dependent aldolase [Streptomyces sp. NPDC047061]|uniref:threonine aldolase family protein n=1 Tax=Streptomyces sp. NPDC047061 TaxID=3154605 RepID=UPI0033CF4ADB